MKHRTISFITALALCLSLCPTRILAAGWEANALDSADTPMVIASDLFSYTLSMNMTIKGPYDVTKPMLFDTCGYSYTASEATTLRVTGTGSLYLTTGTIESKKGSGVEVQTGGSLYVEDADMAVIGKTYGLDISSGAKAQLSGGKFTGEEAAIRVEDGDYGDLLKRGCAYFDASGDPIPLMDVAGKTIVVVKECTAHSYSYTPTPTHPTHDRTCAYCGETVNNAPCLFAFDESGSAVCQDECGHTLIITIDPDKEVYDGTFKPANDPVTVKLDGSEELTKDVDYTVDYTPRVDAGEITVTVASEAYREPYQTTFRIIQAQPVITWNSEPPVLAEVSYDGSPVDRSKLPEVIIQAPKHEDLERLLYFSYCSDGGASYTDGLPTDAGIYQIKANLPETQNYYAASSDPLTLTITKIDSLIEAPIATKPTYNGTVQGLVTPGKVRNGAEIQFSLTGGDPWSTDIPTGINAGDYVAWYRVVDKADNYNVFDPLPISSVKIKRKEITPAVELEYYKCVYDGGYKEPKVTVRDKDDYWNPLPSTEYEVEYKNNQNVGEASVIVTDKNKGNYQIIETAVTFEITPVDQSALTITNLPNTVTYGDKFTLGTSGGSGNGAVTWKITYGSNVATVDENSGQVTVTGVGTATVQATKSDGNNHKDATAEWTFTADKRSVVAAVTADSKTYDGKVAATVYASVEQGVVSGDTITITGLTGTFRDADAGTNKIVDVNIDEASIGVNGEVISGRANEKYSVTIPKTTTADIAKVETRFRTLPTAKKLIYDKTEQALINEAEANNRKNVQVEYALSKDGPYYTTVPTATNAGSYEVWYRVEESANYTGIPAAMVVATIDPKPVNDPVVTLDSDTYVYDGQAKEPAVTVKDGDDVIPSSEYTVTYSNNVNVGNDTATVTVTDNAGGNYTVSEKSVPFSITLGGSAVLTKSPEARDLIYNGNPQDLVTVGTAAGGSLVYAWKAGNSEPEGSDYKEEIPRQTSAGLYKVYYKVKGDNNHTDTEPAYVFVTIHPKTVTSPIITLLSDSVMYNGQEQEPEVVSVEDGNDTIDKDEYTVSYSNNINAGTATVHIVGKNGGNYTVTGSKTFEITKATAKFATPPAAKPDLAYNGKAQPLITAGVPEGGTAVYWLKDEPYFTAIPTGTDRGSYEVWAKVLGDANHEDSAPEEIENVKIGVNIVNAPTVELSSASFRYNGSEQKPTVTIKDDQGNVIPANEYTVTYGGDAPDDTIKVGTYKIEISSKAGGNYSFVTHCTVTITSADQTPLTITGKPSVVRYDDTFQLSATGGSGSGIVEWEITEGTEFVEEGKSAGQFKIIKAGGPITITATRTSDNYENAEDKWTFYAEEKPVTAVVTADKDYDGSSDAALSVTVPGTGITIGVKDNFKGIFDSADVGTNKTVTLTGLSDHVTVTNGENYHIIYPPTTTASIAPADVDLTDKAKPTENNLPYNGSAQPLLTDGAALDGGNWAYSADGVNYSLFVPKATNAGDYEVWYKVIADSNHKDTEPKPVTAKISPTEVTVTVKCSPETFPYDGTEKTPNVIVTYEEEGGGEKVIPASEYTVEFPQPRVAVKTGYVVTVNSNGNYTFKNSATATFDIVPAGQAPLSIVTDKGSTVYYDDTFRLSAVGGSGAGEIKWSVESDPAGVAAITDEGVVTVNGVGSFTVTAYRGADGSHDKSNEASVSFVAKAKPVTAVVTAKDKVFDGDNEVKELTVTVPDTDLIIDDVTGTFADKNVGTNKTVTIHSDNATKGAPNYEITYPTTTTASITPAPTSLDGITVTAKAGLKYRGIPQDLVEAPAVTVDGGSMAYSLDGISYSLVIPTGKDAVVYTVWYKVRGDSNHTDSEPKTVEVTIEKSTPTIFSNPVASSLYSGQQLKESQLTGGKAMFDGVEVPGTFTWTNGNITVTEEKLYEVKFTPYDKANYRSVKTDVEVKVKEAEPDLTPEPETGSGSSAAPDNSANIPATDSPDAGSDSLQASVRDGVASAVLNAAAGQELVNKAIANQSKNVVIKPEVTGDVTKTEVSLPASVVSRIRDETDAVLTVSTPAADVSIPNGALDTLSHAGSVVSIMTEQMENTVTLTLTADGKDIGNIPGGLTLIVSVENAGPGTVAVLVYEDGTRETVRRSVAEGGAVRIPLNGSVTVEIVENSKEFADVPAESWAADAVAFASAREIFNGTGEATFSPELSMSRAMLATVLYNLEGCPDQGPTSAFGDVNSDAWYAAGISWAAANGITSGYGDGQFGPNDSITREQLAVMLWRYMGSPAADEQVHNFTDTDQASSYAMDALCWTAANGILNGYGNGYLDPCGLATRAQVAQMLKNFIENT